jgi:predicted PurR-regulated permease PerM
MSNERLQAVFYGVFLAVLVGWVLYVGKSIFVPIVFSVMVAYVIVGMVRLQQRIPVLGPRLPTGLCYTLSILGIGLVIAAVVGLIVANVGVVVERLPEYQASLLSQVQRLAAAAGVEAEPTWQALQQDFLQSINLQGLIGSTVVSVTSMLASLVIVLLYVTFLLVEQRVFSRKVERLSDDPEDTRRIHGVVRDVNARIGTYLAMKTMINILLGLVSWIILEVMGVQFAAFWAVVIAMLNYVPYIGSFLGVIFPVALAVVQFGEAGPVIMLAVLLIVAQFVIGSLLDPWLMGSSLNLSPFAILTSLAIWSSLWGIAGAFLAVPMMAVLMIVLASFQGTRPIAVLISSNGDLGDIDDQPLAADAR